MRVQLTNVSHPAPKSVPGRPPDSAPCARRAGPRLGNSVRPVLWPGCDLSRRSARQMGEWESGLTAMGCRLRVIAL